MTDLSLPTSVPRSASYAMSVGRNRDGKWVAYCVRDDDALDEAITAYGDSPAQAMALCAELVAVSEDECLELKVGQVREKHCRCEDMTELLEAASQQDSPDDVVVTLTHRMGQCCKCGLQGPVHDEDGAAIPYGAACAVEGTN